MRFLSLALLLALAAPAALAQPGMGAPVVGTVVDDASGESIAGANVAVYQDDAFLTGAATGPDGRFEIGLRPGTYRFRVSFIGYDSVERDEISVSAGAPTDLGEIRMSPNAALLDGAEVTAQREFIEQQADRTVYNVQEQAVTAGGSALETLQTLPSLEVDTDGNVSLRGNQNVAIQINGRPVPVTGAFLAALLRQIPADKVQSVEVIPNPSAKYEPDGMGGIINIKLAEGTDRGLSGGLTLGGGTEPSGNVGANVSYQEGAWDLNAQYGFRYDERNVLSESSLILRNASGETITNRLQNGESGNANSSHFFNGSANYTLFEGADLTFEGSLGLRSGLSDGATLYDFPLGGDATQRLNDSNSDGFNGDAALVFRRKFVAGGASQAAASGGGSGGGFRGGRGFGGPRGGGGTSSDHELAVEARYTRNNNDDLGCFADRTGQALSGDFGDCFALASGLNGRQRQTSDQTNDEASFQVDYTRPLGVTKLEVGGKVSSEWVASDRTYERASGDAFEVDLGQTNAFDYDRQIGAVYVQAARPLGPLQVQVGVRAEVAQRTFDLLTEVPEVPGIPPVDTENASQSYTNLFPSVFLSYPLDQGSLIKGSYTRRVNRPRTFSLNPFPSFEDTTFVRVGNPALTPEYTDSFELGFTYKYFLTVAPFYRRTTDAISRRVFTDPVTGNRTFTQVNFASEDSYGADLTVLAQLGPLRGFVSGSVYQEVTSGEGENESAEGITWSARTSVQAKVREGTDVQFFLFYRGPSNIVGGSRQGFGFSTLGVNQKLSDRLSLSARVNDVFSTARFQFETNTAFSETSSQFDPDIQQVSATLTWTFGSGPKRQPQQRSDQQGGDMGDGFGI